MMIIEKFNHNIDLSCSNNGNFKSSIKNSLSYDSINRVENYLSKNQEVLVSTKYLDLHTNKKLNLKDIEILPDNTIGLFGLGFGEITNLIKESKKKFFIYEPDLQILSAFLILVDLDKCADCKISSSIDDFLSNDLDTVLTHDNIIHEHSGQYQEMIEKLPNKLIKRRAIKRQNPRILVQARRDLYLAKGGDTIALEKSTKALVKLGIDAVIDIECKEDINNFDLVHLYNFSTPQELERLARAAHSANKPYVITSLYEDRNLFFPHMCRYGEILTEHLTGKTTNVEYNLIMANKDVIIANFPHQYILNNNFAAQTASRILTSGDFETKSINKDYPNNNGITVVPFGADGLPEEDEVDKDLFFKKFGIKDYILCVGRIEWRKNQGLLMKALEDSDLNLVLVAGNMTYQPEYEQAVCGYERKGRTLIVNNLSELELASAYKGALLHILPSWYELPGLVSLEAARYGIPVIGSKLGSLPDYLGKEAVYCNPGDIYSIKYAIEQTMATPRNRDNLVKRAKEYTWENTAKKLVEVYNDVLSNRELNKPLAVNHY